MTIRAVVAAGCLIAALRTAAIAGEPQTSPRTGRIPMAFVSDTQTPLLVESLLYGWDRNSEATDSIFADLSRRKPEQVFVLGDLVSFGPYSGSWDKLTVHVTRLRNAGISVHAILGNHEVMLFPQTGEENFQSLFPDHLRTGYCRTVDSVAVVLLNSNFNVLSASETEKQKLWYRSALDSLQNDPGILQIVVCCHHSPFSNSRVVGSSEEVQREFVPPFLATPKCRLFLSGHAHAFEQFRREGKTFLVIGGGGGTRQPLYEGADRKWTDLSPSTKPAYHYLELRRENHTLVAIVRGLNEDFRGFEDTARLRIEGPPGVGPPGR